MVDIIIKVEEEKILCSFDNYLDVRGERYEDILEDEDFKEISKKINNFIKEKEIIC